MTERTRMRATDRSDADYDAIASIWNANWPEYPKRGAQYRHSDEKMDGSKVIERLVAERDDDIVGTGYLRQETDSVASGKFLLYAQVLPASQRQGIGGALLNELIEAALSQGATILQSFTREDRPECVEFLRRRGFEVSMREQNSELDLTAFDVGKYAELLRSVADSGIRILPVSELAGTDPDWKRRLWELNGEIIPDVPDDDVLVNEPFEEFAKLFEHPDYLPDGYFVALDGDEYIGLSSVWRRQLKEAELYTRLTGVVRSHRRRGIATALKVTAADYGRSRGARKIVTDNEENNPMYLLNVALGFRPTHAWLQFRHEVQVGR